LILVTYLQFRIFGYNTKLVQRLGDSKDLADRYEGWRFPGYSWGAHIFTTGRNRTNRSLFVGCLRRSSIDLHYYFSMVIHCHSGRHIQQSFPNLFWLDRLYFPLSARHESDIFSIAIQCHVIPFYTEDIYFPVTIRQIFHGIQSTRNSASYITGNLELVAIYGLC
jgi:hypothetical protein